MELNKLSSWEASSSSNVKTICTGLSGLPVSSKLYRDIEKKKVLVNAQSSHFWGVWERSCRQLYPQIPMTQQALAQHQHQKWVNKLQLESSLMY